MIRRVGSVAFLGFTVLLVSLLTSPALTQQDTFSGAVDTYFGAIEAYDSGNANEAIRGLRNALKVFQRDKSEKGEFMVYLSLADIYREDGKYDKAMVELEKARELKQRSRDILGEGVVLLHMGELEADRSRFDEARKLLEESLVNVAAMEAEHLIAIIETERARVLIITGELGEAKSVLKKALIVHQKNDDDYHQAVVLMRLAKIERIQNRYDQAFTLLSQAEKITADEGYDALRHHVLDRMARVLNNQGHLKEAREKLEKSAEFFAKAGKQRESARARTKIAAVMMKEGRLQEAHNHLQQASTGLRGLEADYEGAHHMVVEGRLLVRTGRLTEAMKLIDKAFRFFTDKEAPMGELSARIAQARLEIAQGRPSAAILDAHRCLELALMLKTPQGEADAMFVDGLVHAAEGNHEEAVVKLGKALKLYRTLENARGEARCRIHRAASFIEIGFLDRARQDVTALEKLSTAEEDLFVRGHILFLKAMMAAAGGDSSTALTELNKARAILSKLSSPLDDALLLEWNAKLETSRRNYYKALQLWEKAENIFAGAESPGGVLRCREAQLGILLERDDTRQAQAIARKSLRIPWQRGYGSQKKDTDAALLDARLACLRARVKLASGDLAGAERDAAKALDTAVEARDTKASTDMALLLGQIYMAQGKYGEALKRFETSGDKANWRSNHAQAMSLVAQGKRQEALPILGSTIEKLAMREAGEGLATVPVRVMRERESLYEDYIDTLVAAGRKLGSKEYFNRAWDAAQRLKVRRLLHLRSAVAAVEFPGVPEAVLTKLDRLQRETINRVKRNTHPALNEKTRQEGKNQGEGTRPAPYAEVEAFLNETGKEYRHLAGLWRGACPSISEAAAKIGPGECYVTIVSTKKRFHSFLVGTDGVKAAASSPATDTVVRHAETVTKGIDSPYYYRLDKAANELWTVIFGSFAKEIDSAKTLIVETDGLFTVFPFEALVPGEFPESYQDQQNAELLLEKMPVVRTTSALRFVQTRERTNAGPPSKLVVFAQPSLPKESGSDSVEGAQLLSTWKRALAAFSSSPGIEEANVFGKNGTVYTADRASRSHFLAEQTAQYPLIQLACPVLIPRTPAGRLFQPFVVFSPANNDPTTVFCGISDLSGTKRPANVAVLTWISRTDRTADQGMVLLLETLGLTGIRAILLPLWQGDRQGEAETTQFLTTFYGALKNGDTPAAALQKARETLKQDSSRKNRCNPARFALF